MILHEEQIKKFLIDSGLVSRRDIEEAFVESREKKTSLGDVLVAHDKLSFDDVRKITAHATGVPFISLKGEKLEPETMSLVPEPIAREHNIISFRKTDKGVEIAVLNLEDVEHVAFLEKKHGLKILPRLTDASSIKSALLEYQKTLKKGFDAVVQTEVKNFTDIENNADSSWKKRTEGTAMGRILDAIVRRAVSERASYIHIEPRENELLVRFRIHGRLYDSMVLSKAIHKALIEKVRMVVGLSGSAKVPEEGSARTTINGEDISLKVSLTDTVGGERAVIRIEKNSPSVPLISLGLQFDALEKIHKALEANSGLMLIAGPKKSGKTALLYSMLLALRDTHVNISTIEDSIVSILPRVNQIKTDRAGGFVGVTAFRAALRQDADVIGLDMAEDTETTLATVAAASRGRSVLVTVEEKTAARAISKILEFKADPFVFSSCLSCAVSVRLAKRLASETEKRLLSRTELSALSKVVDLDRMLSLLRREHIVGQKAGWDKVFFPVLKKSEEKNQWNGYIGLFEVIEMTSALRELVAKSSSSGALEVRAKKEGMVSIVEDGILKAAQGFTTVEEVLRAVSE